MPDAALKQKYIHFSMAFCRHKTDRTDRLVFVQFLSVCFEVNNFTRSDGNNQL